MLERIKTLILLQLKNRLTRREKGSFSLYKTIAVNAVILIIVSIVATYAIYAIKNIFFIPVNEYFAVFILVIVQVINIISSVVHISDDLYHNKDNQILFPLPVNNNEIFISKLSVYFIQELIKNLYFLVPILIAIGFSRDASPWYYFNLIPIVVILPLISVFVATLLSIPFVYLKNYLKEHSLISAISTITIILALGISIYFLVIQIPIPIRLVQLYNNFIIELTLLMQQTAKYSFVYTNIGFILFSRNVFINYLIIIVFTLTLAALVYLSAKPLYFKLTSRSMEHTTKKKKYIKIKQSKSLFRTFLNKEVTIARRSPSELINNYGLLFFLPIIMFVLNYIYMGMNRSTMGNDLVLVLNVFIVLLIVLGSNTQAASAITSEGYEFILLKTAPYDTSKIVWAKLFFNILVTTIIITISFIIFALVLPQYPKSDIIFLYLLVNIINFGHILWSIELDVLNPKLSDYATSGNLNNNINIQKSLSIGLVISIMFALLSVISFILVRDLGWYLMITTAIIFTIYRFISLKRYSKVYFVEIEY